MKHRRKSSHFKRLFAYNIILGVLLVALTGFMLLSASFTSIGGGLERQTHSGVSAVAEGLNALIDNCAATIRELAVNETVRGFIMAEGGVTRYDAARILYLSSVSGAQNVTVHAIRVKDGEIASTGTASAVFSPENYNPSFTLFHRILSTEGVALYTTVKGINMRPETRLIQAMAVKDADNAPVGYVAIEVTRDAIAAVASGYSSLSARPVLVIDPYDTVVFSSMGEGGEGLNRLAYQSDFSQIWAADAPREGFMAADNLCWARLPGARYAVVSEVSTELIESVRASASSAILPVLLVACAVGVLFAYIVARTVSSPIRRMTAAMREVERGNFTANVPVTSNDEIGQLSEAFNHMQSQIEGLIERVEEKQQSLRAAEMGALSLQVNPHFLYNTLDLIKWLIKLERSGDAAKVVVQLGKLLRQLMNNQSDVVTMAEELEFAQAYLDIQQLRHQGKIGVRFDVEAGLAHVRIPKLILQPLIENAIVHGLEDVAEGGTLTVSARRSGRYIVLKVADSGEGMSEERLRKVKRMEQTGMYNIGLSNVNRRARLYGDDACGLVIESAEGVGTTITLTLLAMGDNEGGDA